jgi:hypothetical protein
MFISVGSMHDIDSGRSNEPVGTTIFKNLK